MTKTQESIWLAAMFEGEGSCGVYATNKGRTTFVRMQVTTTDKDVAEAILRIAGCGRIYEMERKGKKLAYRWQISRRDSAVMVAAMIEPYLYARRRAQIRDVLSHC